MPSQAPDTGYGRGGGGSGGAKGRDTLRTLTIRQLAKGLANADDENFVVEGVQLANLTVVGRIVNVMDRGSNLVANITDGTGDLEVTYWLQEDSEHAMQSKKAELRQGVYVKAHGHIRNHDKKLSLSAFNMRAITNFNEVTYHFLRAIFEHLHFSKGGAAGGGAQDMPAAGGFANPAAGGWGGAPRQQQQQPMGGGATAFAGAGGGDSCQDAVLAIIQGADNDTGVHVEQIYNALPGKFNRGQIDTALQGLMNDAHIYNTTDDYHFKAT